MFEAREAEQADDSLRVDVTPRRRQSGLTVVEVGGETLVYDLRTHHAHCLNATTAFVWHKCDGERSAAAIAAALEREHGIATSSGVVWLALEQLDNAELLDRPAQRAGVNLSRRLVLRSIAAAGLAATVLPALSSITAPTAAAATSCPAGQVLCGATCCTAGQTCVGGTTCCANAQVCGASCCVAGSTTCVSGACCANARVCGATCCAAGVTCISGACCANAQVCGAACCPAGTTCLGGALCCANAQVCGATCCLPSDICCGGTTCCPLGSICVGSTCLMI